MTGEERAAAFAALVAEQEEVRDVAALAELGLTGEIASLRLTLLGALREIADPFQRSIAVAKLAEALARVQGAARAAEPEGADELGRVLAGVLGEMGVGE